MRACVLHKKQDIKLEEKFIPEINHENEVLVKVVYAGICGSDIHYYAQGANGSFKVSEPYVLGHEASGVVVKVGSSVNNVCVGQKVAIDPNVVCYTCSYCRASQSNQCTTGKLMGSASVIPHLDGVFRDFVVIKDSQCIVASNHVDLKALSLTEPLAVVLHALNNMPTNILGKSIWISGAGTIGCLMAQVCKLQGASKIVMVEPNTAAHHRAIASGADEVYEPNDQAVSIYTENKGYFDLSVEAAGALPAINQCINVTKPYGTMLQVGMFGSPTLEVSFAALAAKEIHFIGAFRTANEFEAAASLIENDKINTDAIISHQFEPAEIVEAMQMSMDKTQACKVLLYFGEK